MKIKHKFKTVTTMLLSVAASVLFLVSCGSDDSNGNNTYYLPTTVMLDDEPHTFTYNGDRRIASVSVNGNLFNFSYMPDGRVQQLTSVTEGGEIAEFIYNEDGRLIQITSTNGDNIMVTPGPGNSFSVDGDTFTLTDAGDWDSFAGFYEFAYSGGRGIFADVRDVDVLALALVDEESIFFASKREITSASIGTTFLYDTTRNEDGNISSINIADTGTITVTYMETDN